MFKIRFTCKFKPFIAPHSDVYIRVSLIGDFIRGSFLYVPVIMSTYFRFGYGMCDNEALERNDSMSQTSIVPMP